MSSSSTLCTIEKCEFVSLALCQCCKKDLCIAHLNEHSNQRSGKLLPLVDRINVLVNRFNQFYDGEQSESKQLEQWREQAYRLIDEFYQKKRDEYSSSSNDPYRIQLHQIRTSVNELIRKKGGSQEDIERFSKELQTIEEHLDRLKHLPFALQPLTINEQCVLQLSTPNNQSSSSSISVATQTDEPISEKQEETEKNSKKKRKSHRRSDVSSDRSSRHQSRSPHRRDRRSKKSNERKILLSSFLHHPNRCVFQEEVDHAVRVHHEDRVKHR